MDEFYDYIITKPNMEDILEHHGVKGMRWGHRKERFRGKGKIAKYRENKKSQRVINSKEENSVVVSEVTDTSADVSVTGSV